MRYLTGREWRYLGDRCQHREKDDRSVGPFHCWAPASHRVVLGPYGWWFVCFDHVESIAARKTYGKATVRTLVPSREAAFAAAIGRLVFIMGGKGKR